MTTDLNTEAVKNTAVIPANEQISEPAVSTRIKNRRNQYLHLHPQYFSSALELADPLLYDRLVRRFQTPAEREAEGRAKGYSGSLEADLLRSEAKIEALASPDPAMPLTYRRGANGEILAEDKDDAPASKEQGLARWRRQMALRFLRGDDEDFDYGPVDNGEDYDDFEQIRRDEEDRYFDGEEPSFTRPVGEAPPQSVPELLKGETGVQDF